jgi:hypothetical protein
MAACSCTWAPAATSRPEDSRWGGCRSGGLVGSPCKLDSVAATLRGPPGAAPGDRLGAISRASSSALPFDLAVAMAYAAGFQGEQLGPRERLETVGKSRPALRVAMQALLVVLLQYGALPSDSLRTP